MNKPAQYLVSVITAFMNEERFLAEAIESVRQQDYENWELILIDDGSSDGSTAIAKKYAEENAGKIIYTDHENHANKGVSASRNHGIAIAKGELIAVLDADDIWLPSKLRLQVNVMAENPEAALLCEASEYWYSWNGINQKKDDRVIQVGKELDQLFHPPHLMETLYPLSTGDAPCPSGIVVRKNALDKHLGFEEHFTGRNQMYEDQAFFSKFYLNELVYISSKCNNRYRQREGSLVQKVNYEGDYVAVRKYFLDWLKKYLGREDIKYSYVDELLKRAYEPYDHPMAYSLKKLGRRIIARLKKM